MKIVYRKQAVKALRAMPSKTSGRIVEALKKLAEEPSRTDLDVRPLTGRPEIRLRIGDWRAIILVTADCLTVTRIAPRGDVYKS